MSVSSHPLIWRSDADGAACLLQGPKGAQLWISPRQVYCDRGHWQLGVRGLTLSEQPSLYFHRFATAQREAELWLARGLGRPVVQAEPQWPTHTWRAAGDAVWTRRTFAGPRQVEFELTKTGKDESAVWTVAVTQGLDTIEDSLDAADGFPRCFLNGENAIHEVEDFIRWRLHKEPAEVPGRIHRPDEPVAISVQRALGASGKIS